MARKTERGSRPRESAKAQGNPTLFLDRDGTINIDMGPRYLSSPEGVKMIPGAGAAVLRARAAGFKISVITNQAGVAKGLTPAGSLPLIHSRIEELIDPAFRFDDIQICAHHPDEKCKCRKPEVGLLEASIKKLEADVSRSFFVGDKCSDLLCANRMGVPAILVLTGHGFEAQAELRDSPELPRPVGIVPSLAEAVELALRLRD